MIYAEAHTRWLFVNSSPHSNRGITNRGITNALLRMAASVTEHGTSSIWAPPNTLVDAPEE